MSFTVSTNLELVARGAEVGTWDTPENSNWSIVDAALGNVATVALTNSPITLSQSQYQCNFINFTGAISANIAITLPAVGRYYTIQNLTSNTSAFYITMTTTAAGGQAIGIPPGTPTEVMTDGTNVKFRGLERIGTYVDVGWSAVPGWLTACTVPPYLNCAGAAFSSATYPILATVLGGTTLPDSKGRFRATLTQGSGRLTGSVTNGLNATTILTGGGLQTTTLVTANLPAYTPSGTNTDTTATLSGGLAGPLATTTCFTGGSTPIYAIGAGVTLPVSGIVPLGSIPFTGNAQGGTSTPTNNVPPSYAGGLTLIRAG